jgi:hypothetical protein
MPQKKNNYGDSVRAWASGYKDSVAVDYDASQMRTIYVHKDDKDSWKGKVEENGSTASASWQYYVVPSFFAIVITMVIFAFVLFGDEAKKKAKDSVLDFIKTNDSKKNKKEKV